MGESQILPSVRQWLDWKITNVLPKAGGTLNQDPIFMRDLRNIVSMEQKHETHGRNIRDAQAEIKRRVGR